MDKGSTIILRGVIWIIGLAVLGLCLFLLYTAANAMNLGYYRPLLIGLCVPAIPFFMALRESLKLLSFIDQNKAFSNLSVKSLTNIKNCGLAISGLYALGMPYIVYVADRDDAPGVVAMGLVVIFASFVVATAAAVFSRLLKNAVEIKSENDLTV